MLIVDVIVVDGLDKDMDFVGGEDVLTMVKLVLVVPEDVVLLLDCIIVRLGVLLDRLELVCEDVVLLLDCVVKVDLMVDESELVCEDVVLPLLVCVVVVVIFVALLGELEFVLVRETVVPLAVCVVSVLVVSVLEVVEVVLDELELV